MSRRAMRRLVELHAQGQLPDGLTKAPVEHSVGVDPIGWTTFRSFSLAGQPTG